MEIEIEFAKVCTTLSTLRPDLTMIKIELEIIY